MKYEEVSYDNVASFSPSSHLGVDLLPFFPCAISRVPFAIINEHTTEKTLYGVMAINTSYNEAIGIRRELRKTLCVGMVITICRSRRP